MNLRASAERMRGKWRRNLFWFWVVASIVVAVYVAGLGPVASYFGEGREYIAIASTALMLLMLGTGLGWLILFVFAKRKRPEPGRDSR